MRCLSGSIAPILAEQVIEASQDSSNLMHDSTSGYEIALPLYYMASFAAFAGYYKGLPDEIRIQQLDYLSEFLVQTYT